MADIISEIIAPNVNPDLDGLINKLISIGELIESIDKKQIAITVDLKGAESLNGLNAVMERNKELLADLTKLKEENGAVTQNYNRQQIETAQGIATTTKEMKELTAQIKNLKELQAKINPNHPGYKQLGVEIENLNAKMRAFGGAMRTAGGDTNNFQINIGKTVISLQSLSTQIGRAIIRFGAYAIVIGGAVTAFNYLKTAIMETVRGSDAWIEKMDKIIQSNESIKKSFGDIAEAVSKLKGMQAELNDTLDESAEGLKRKAALVKSIGVLNGQIYDAEKSQMDADNAVRAKELVGLESKYKVYQKLADIIEKTSTVTNAATGQLDQSLLVKAVAGSGLPSDIKDKFNVDLFKDTKDLSAEDAQIAIYKNLKNIILDYKTATREIEQSIENNKNSTAVGNQSLTTKQRELEFSRKYDLEKQVAQTREQFRQANEKEDAASLDKIVADTKAKYIGLARDVAHNKAEYVKNFAAGHIDDNTRAYDNLLSLLKKIGEQERKNAQFELTQQQYAHSLQIGATLASGRADISKFASSNGVPNYNAMSGVIDDQANAKKEALKAHFQQMASTITDSNQIIEAQKQQDEKLKQVDQESYRERLALANEFFTRLTLHTVAATALITEGIQTATLNKITDVLNGGGSLFQKDKDAIKTDRRGQKKEALANIEGADNQMKPAKEALDKNTSALALAQFNEVENPDEVNAGKVAAAQKEVDASKKKVSELERIEAESRNIIAQINNDEDREQREKIKEKAGYAIEVAQETMQAVITIKNNQFAHEQELLDKQGRIVQLQAAQQIQSINASTGYAIQKKNQLSLVNAQATAAENAIEMKKRQMNIEQARYNRTAAEASIIVNTAAGITKALVDPGWPEAIPIMIATAAIGAVQFAAASSAPIPTYRYGTDNHPGGLAIVGEARQSEYVQTPTGESFWSKPEATLLDLPTGSTVTPLPKMWEYATSSIGKNDTIDISALSGARQDAVMYKYIADTMGRKIEDQTDDIVTALYGSRTPPQNHTKDIQYELLKNQYFHNQKK